MTIATSTKLALTALALGGGLLLFAGTSHAATVDPALAAAKGTADGCARGTADAKAGKTAAQAAADLNVGGKDAAALLAAADASGDRKAYGDAYIAAHAECFLKNTIIKDSVPPVVTPPPKKTDPVVIHKDSVKGKASWDMGARRGAQKGWVQGISGVTQSTPSGSSTDVPEAYKAGYRCGFGRGLSLANAFPYKAVAPAEIDLDAEDEIVGKCAVLFPAWWTGFEGASISTAGVAAGTGQDASHHYPNNVVLRAMSKVAVAGVALVGVRRGIYTVRRPGDVHEDDLPTRRADADTRGDERHPAWPGGAMGDAPIYRSFGKDA